MLSVVIVNYNSEYRLRQAVDAVLARPVRGGVEVVVVDNESTDGSADFIGKNARYAAVSLVRPPVNVGYTEGNNIGCDLARGDVVLLMTPDRYPLDDSLDRMVAYFEADASLGAIGGVCLRPDGTIDHLYHDLPTPWMSYLWAFWRDRGATRLRAFRRFTHADEDFTKPFECAQPVGGAFAFRRALLTTPVTDPGFGLLHGDVDTSRRVADTGLRTMVFPDVRFVHDHDEKPSNPVRGPFIALDYYVGVLRYHRIRNGTLSHARAKALFGIHLTAWIARDTLAWLVGRQARERNATHWRVYGAFWRERNILLEATKAKMRAAGMPRSE